MLVRTQTTFRKMNEFEQFVVRKIMNDLLEECLLANVDLCKQWFSVLAKILFSGFFLILYNFSILMFYDCFFLSI